MCAYNLAAEFSSILKIACCIWRCLCSVSNQNIIFSFMIIIARRFSVNNNNMWLKFSSKFFLRKSPARDEWKLWISLINTRFAAFFSSHCRWWKYDHITLAMYPSSWCYPHFHSHPYFSIYGSIYSLEISFAVHEWNDNNDDNFEQIQKNLIHILIFKRSEKLIVRDTRRLIHILERMYCNIVSLGLLTSS